MLGVQHDRRLMECIAEINLNPGNIKLLKKRGYGKPFKSNEMIKDETELRNVREATDATFRKAF